MRTQWMLSGLMGWMIAAPLPRLAAHAQGPMRSPVQSSVRTQAAQDVAMSEDQTAVVATLRAMYSAASADDLPLFHAQIASGFYAFDGGKRFDGDALMRMILDYHAKGVSFVWTVVNPDVHVHGDHAWIAYTNQGSITMSPGATPMPMTWRESASLVKRGGAWKIEFFHSTRVPPAEAAK